MRIVNVLACQRWTTADEINWISSKIRTDEDLSRILAAARRRSDWGEINGGRVIEHLEVRLGARRRIVAAGIRHAAVMG